MIHEEVKKVLESKGWDLSSDFFDDDELTAIGQIIEATLEVITIHGFNKQMFEKHFKNEFKRKVI